MAHLTLRDMLVSKGSTAATGNEAEVLAVVGKFKPVGVIT
jgi:hypothetical protein